MHLFYITHKGGSVTSGKLTRGKRSFVENIVNPAWRAGEVTDFKVWRVKGNNEIVCAECGEGAGECRCIYMSITENTEDDRRRISGV